MCVCFCGWEREGQLYLHSLEISLDTRRHNFHWCQRYKTLVTPLGPPLSPHSVSPLLTVKKQKNTNFLTKDEQLLSIMYIYQALLLVKWEKTSVKILHEEKYFVLYFAICTSCLGSIVKSDLTELSGHLSPTLQKKKKKQLKEFQTPTCLPFNFTE